MRRFRVSTCFILLSIILISGCSKSTIENLGETIADDLQNGPLGGEVIKEEETPQEPENQEKEENEEENIYLGSVTANVNGGNFKNWDGEDFNFLDTNDFRPLASVEIYPTLEGADGEVPYLMSIAAWDFDFGITKAKYFFLLVKGNNFKSLVAGQTYDQLLTRGPKGPPQAISKI